MAIRRTGNPSHSWSIAFVSAQGEPRTVEVRFLVDATGRRAAIARRLGATAIRIDRLVCCYALHPAGPPSDLDRFSIVEAVPNGWFYGARLPSGARLVAYHTDSDLASKGSWRREFADLVAGTVIARAFHTDEAPRSSPPLPARVAAWSGYSSACTGDGWAAVGDAACCFDPLSSQGLFNALYGALQLAPAITAGLAGDRRAIADYAGRLGSIWAAYRRHYGAYYRLERRWPNRAFWRRRNRPGR
jgi:flavin-dependent dehydrogenase